MHFKRVESTFIVVCALGCLINAINAQEQRPPLSEQNRRFVDNYAPFFGLNENYTQDELNKKAAQLLREKGSDELYKRELESKFNMLTQIRGNASDSQYVKVQFLEKLGDSYTKEDVARVRNQIKGPVFAIEQAYDELKSELLPHISGRGETILQLPSNAQQEDLTLAYANILEQFRKGLISEEDKLAAYTAFVNETKRMGNNPSTEFRKANEQRMDIQLGKIKYAQQLPQEKEEILSLLRQSGVSPESWTDQSIKDAELNALRKGLGLAGDASEQAIKDAYVRKLEYWIKKGSNLSPEEKALKQKLERFQADVADMLPEIVSQETAGKLQTPEEMALEKLESKATNIRKQLREKLGLPLDAPDTLVFEKLFKGGKYPPSDLDALWQDLVDLDREIKAKTEGFELIDDTPLTKEQEQKIELESQLGLLYKEMREQTKKAFTIDFQELKGVNIDNLFLNKILSLIPQKDVAVFKKFRIKTPTFFEAPELKKGQYGFGVKGSMIFDGAEVTVYVLLVRGIQKEDGTIDKSQWGISVGIKMPDKWNISSRYPFLAKLDELSLFSPQVIYSNFDYQTSELGIVKKGFNLVAFVNLTGPLQKFESLVQANKPYLIAQGGKMRLNGVIGNSLATSSIGVTIPLYLGVDFDALYKTGKKKRPPSFLRRITTDDIVVSLKGNGEWEARAGVIVYLVAQENPISFGAGLKFKAPLWTFFGEMKGMWDPAFGQEWLALGNAGIEILVNTAMAASTGVPFTGFAAQGSFALGKPGDGRVTSSIAGKIAIPISDGFLLDGKLSKASLSDAIMLLARMVGRPIEGKMPDIEFNNLQMRIVPVSDYIGTTRYSQGVRISAGMKIGNFGGGIDFAISNEDKTIEGGGYILPISNPIFKLTGLKEENPQMSMKIGFVGMLKDSEILGFIPGVSKLQDFPIPASFEMKIDGSFELPWLGYRQAVSFSLDDQGLFYRREKEKMFNTEMKTVEFRIPFGSFDGFLYRYELESNTMQSIKDSIREYLGSWKSSLLEAAERGRQDLRVKLERKQHEIEDLRQQRARLEESCKEKTKDIKNIFSKEYWKGVKDCMNVAVKAIDEQATKLDKELSNMTLQVSETLRPENVPAAMFDAASTIADVATAMQITKIFGEMSGADIRQGKLPRVTIELAFDVFGKRSVHTLRDVQFDFKDPKGSAKAIGEAIKQFFKG